MGFLELPTELRLQIYSYLPELSTASTVTVATGNPLTPAISRTNHYLRHETLPIYAQNARFTVYLATGIEQKRLISNALNTWLNGLGPLGLARLSRLNLSRHWELSRPSRGQAHVGFYLFLTRDLTLTCGTPNTQGSRRWQITIGTYPIARDLSGMRLQSAQLLERTVISRLEREVFFDSAADITDGTMDMKRDFSREDMEYVISAMDIIARHPFSTFEPQEEAKQRQLAAFEKMKDELSAL